MRRDGEITDHDLAEVEKFKGYLRYRADHPEMSERDCYAAVYGEVVFDAAEPTETKGTR